MIKEKIIFWPLLAVFIVMLVFNFASQGKKKEAQEELLREIELATKKTAAKNKISKDKWDFDSIKGIEPIDGYKLLLERSPFFRVKSKVAVAKKVKPIVVEEAPKEVVLKYKGRVVLGEKVMVIIEDQGTGKSSFLQEGDTVGDYLLMHIYADSVVLKKKGGEEIVLSAVKKEGSRRTDDEQEKAEKK